MANLAVAIKVFFSLDTVIMVDFWYRNLVFYIFALTSINKYYWLKSIFHL